jgi:N-formylglutamate deformylase
MSTEAPRCGLVIHMPHASRAIPNDVRSALTLTDHELELDLLRMTDAYTDELFAFAEAETVVFPLAGSWSIPSASRRTRTSP